MVVKVQKDDSVAVAAIKILNRFHKKKITSQEDHYVAVRGMFSDQMDSREFQVTDQS